MAQVTGARLLVDCLLEQGVTTAFGVPGESYLAVLDALHDTPPSGWCRTGTKAAPPSWPPPGAS